MGLLHELGLPTRLGAHDVVVPRREVVGEVRKAHDVCRESSNLREDGVGEASVGVGKERADSSKPLCGVV